MPYSAEISRANPTCFLFIIDQSGSMADLFAIEQGKKKSDAVSDIVNRLLSNLAIRSAKAEGIRDYFHVGVIGYGATIGPAFAGSLSGRELVPISEVANSPLRVEERMKKVDDGAGGLAEQKIRFPIWFEPVANGGTPMCQALGLGKTIIEKWINQHPGSYPPAVFNITDGEPTDGNPLPVSNELKILQGNDGNALLFNLHISSKQGAQIFFPDNESILPDEHARLLFNMSSVMPEVMRGAARQEGFNVSEASRGFVFNVSDPTAVIQWLDIGTRASNLR